MERETPQSSPSEQPTGSLFRDWLEEIYPRDFIHTFKSYFRNHKKFFDEVFSEQWENKVKPIPFFFTCIALVFLAGSISPWGNPLDDTPTAFGVFKSLNENEKYEFRRALELEEGLQDSAIMESHIGILLNKIESPVMAKDLQEYFEKPETAHPTLAARSEYVVLKNQAENELGDLEFTFVLNFFLFIVIIWWAISHRFLKHQDRTMRQTVYVYMYNMSMLLLFVYVPIMFLGDDINELTGYLALIPLVALIFLIYKSYRVFRYTHNAGFGRLIRASILTSLVIFPGFFIPLLFISSKPKVAVPKA